MSDPITVASRKEGAILTRDGDGQVGKRLNRFLDTHNGNNTFYEEPDYSIYSSVTGDKVTTLTSTGQKLHTYVYLNGEMIADQNYGTSSNSQLYFKQTDPITASETQTDASGTVSPSDFGRLEVESLGSVIPTQEEEISLTTHSYESGSAVGNPEMCGAEDGTLMSCLGIEAYAHYLIAVDSAFAPRPSDNGGLPTLKHVSKKEQKRRKKQAALLIPSGSDNETFINVSSIPGMVGAGKAGDEDFDKIYATPPCNVAKYDDLSPGQKALIDRETYDNPGNFAKGLNELERAVFVNITGQLEKAGIDLTGLTLQPRGVEEDRLLFAPGSTSKFQASISGATVGKSRTFQETNGLSGLFEDAYNMISGSHAGYIDFMARQNVLQNSVQVGFGDKGAFADIDLWNPYLPGNKHAKEVAYNHKHKVKTPHFYLAKILGNCR